MSGLVQKARSNVSYAFFGVGVIWLAVAVAIGSALALWPVVACVASGAMLRLLPGRKLTWAWVLASASLGLVLSAYQVYAWAPFIGGAFTALAGIVAAGFGVFAIAHAVLFYLGVSKSAVAKSGSS